MAMEQFHYTTEAGAEVTLKKFKHCMTLGYARKNRHLSEQEQVFGLLEQHASKKALDVLDALDQDEAQKFLEAWAEDSQVSPGESKAS